MKCENCGKNEVTFMYQSNINGKITKDCPFRVIKIPGGYRIHTRSFFEWLDGKL